MTGFLPMLLAVSVTLHGVIGQSAFDGEAPLAFTGVRSLTGLPGERIVFIGDDGLIYTVRAGRPVSTGQPAKGTRLDFDGKTLRSLGVHHGVWEIDTETFVSRQTVKPTGVRWDLAGVRPETPNHPFTMKCKFVTWDPRRDKMIAYDESGAEKGELFALPERKGNCRIECFGFLPDTGDLAMVTYWPDLQIQRFAPNGTVVIGDGWPVRRGFGFLCPSDGKLWHCGTDSVVAVADNMTGPRPVKLPPESELNGIARQNGSVFLGTSQGLYVKEPGSATFSKRLGGIGRLTALAINDGYIFLSAGEKIRWMYLDGDENEPFASSDRLVMRIANGTNWKDRILDIAPDGKGWLKVATGDAGLWRFRYETPAEHVNERKMWLPLSADPTERASSRKPSEKLLKMLAAASDSRGIEVGKVAASGRWIVAEDVKNHRLLRFRVESKRGGAR